MKLLSFWPPIPGAPDVVRISVEVADGIRLHKIKIANGCVLARNATFSPEAAKQISDLVLCGKGARLNEARKV
ncbi:hypothetical protein HAP47_0021805 [Bradyrhizobium sp. 41S5]|uniref:hypothetical protein n=1 Tax=Bradyrhizobium sp. 41S5 TaxID=1404443 RepID=UPI00156B0C69|nr:hypothetical protein [Bradyrhizobium sp. 41S5]UFX41935.1 hypothetical protein HAP47_0021805 [Bradyrhizobium sp. 41S5]